MVKLELGCGGHNSLEDGWTGVDVVPWNENVVACNLGCDRWPFDDESIHEARALHLLQYLEPNERVHFFNELWRVLRVDGQCKIQVPHWNANKAYGDMVGVSAVGGIKWPPVTEHIVYFLSYKFRRLAEPNYKHPLAIDPYQCNFATVSSAYVPNPVMENRSDEYQRDALQMLRDMALEFVFFVQKYPMDKDTG